MQYSRFILPLFLFFMLFLSGCYKGKKADLVIYNAQIHTLADNGIDGDAIAIQDGKILEVGPERQIRNKYHADEEIDAGGRDMYPGLTDAHGHLIARAKQLLYCDLTGAKSLDEVIVRLEKHQSKSKQRILVGFGWDESLWSTQAPPTNQKLNQHFPSTPVCLFHTDNQRLLVNQAMYNFVLNKEKQTIAQTEIKQQNEPYTGMVNGVDLTIFEEALPTPTKSELMQAFLTVQQELHQYGIIGIHEAGITHEEIQFLKQFMDNPQANLEIYAMLKPSKANIDFAKKQGVYTYKNLTIRSFKLDLDGSIDSHQAALKDAYQDINTTGTALIQTNELRLFSTLCVSLGYQLNASIHGDAACQQFLDQGKWIFSQRPDHRWRIEHAQLIDRKDLQTIAQYGFFPSVQPAQIGTAQKWIVPKIGIERIKEAFAFKSLLQQYGMLAIGTNFPFESADPFRNLYAAVNRTNEKNEPQGGFNPTEALTLNDFFSGMTKWAAFAAFREHETGTIEAGKQATFVLFDQPVSVSTAYTPNFAWRTYLQGKCVYSADLL